jgi:exodeoxyribonuclease-3
MAALQAARVKVATWNVNSVRARLGRLLDYLRTRAPDVLCLQEIKCTDEQFPRLELEALGYRAALFGQKAYNGVAILSKAPVTEVARNMGPGDEQARLICGTVDGVTIVSLYAPNGQSVDSEAYAYKLEWYGRLSRWLEPYAKGPLLVCGDFNIAPEPIDTWDPKLWEGQTLFTLRERNALRELMEHNRLVDLFRAKHPGEGGRFSWWDYRAGAFHKNQGLRIDHLLATAPLVERCVEADIDREARKGAQPSDHAPVWALFT